MSNASRFLKAIRLRRSWSESHVAYNAKMTTEAYLDIESDPCSVPQKTLNKVFDALKVTEDEYTDFQIVARQEMSEARKKDREKLKIVPLHKSIGINDEKKEKNEKCKPK